MLTTRLQVRACAGSGLTETGQFRFQFHQRFTHAFFVRKLSFGSFSSHVLALAPKFRTKKNARKR